jgi:hypothetical protein
MVLQNSGTEIKASQINIELGRAANATFQFGGATERGLAGVANGLIRLGNFYGKSNTPSASLNMLIYAYDNQSVVDRVASSLRTVASSLSISLNLSALGVVSSGSIPYNSSYDVVFNWNNNSGPANYASALDTYISNNKGVILGLFANTNYNSPYNNGFNTNYRVVTSGGYTTSNLSYNQTGLSDGGTGILTGVGNVRVSYYNQSFGTLIRGSSIGTSPNGGIAAYYESSLSLGRRVDINTWYGDGTVGSDAGATRLLLNAGLWAGRKN